MKHDFPVAALADAYVARVDEGILGGLEHFTRQLIWNAYQAGLEKGLMLEYERGRLQGEVSSFTPHKPHNYKSEGIGQCGICGGQRGGKVHGLLAKETP